MNSIIRLYNRILKKLKKSIPGNSTILKKKIIGKNNTLVLSKGVRFNNALADIEGNNNTITIGDYCRFNNFNIFIRGDNHKILINEFTRFNKGGSIWIEDNNCLVEINRRSTFEDVHIACTEPFSKIIIGEDCMFANDIDIRTGDSHSILDSKNLKRINYASNVIISNHVWVGSHCSILKGVKINENCIIATRSVVTRTIEKSGVILGGIPVRVLKEGVTWCRERIYDGK
jgi:acetyltransferase-like isoleucine patch superfamily enzyme